MALASVLLACAPGSAWATPSDHVVFVANRSKKPVKCFRIFNGSALPIQTLPAGGGLKIESPQIVLACPGVIYADPASGGALLSAGNRYQLSRADDGLLYLNHVGLIA